MHALEHLRIEHVLELLHRGAQHVRLAIRVQAHVVARGVDPVDGGDVEPDRLAARPDRQYFRVATRVGRAGCAGRSSALRREFAIALYFGEQRHELFALRDRLLLLPLRANPAEGGGETRVVHGLEQVVERVGFKSLDRITVERGHEHDHRHALLRHLRDHLQTRKTRHLDVEEHEVRRFLGDGGYRFAAVGALAHDGDVGHVLETQFEAPSRQGFIVHDESADRHVGCVARSNGIVISSRRPGLEKRTASFCWSP